MSALLSDVDVREAAAARDRERLQGVWNFVTGRRKVQLVVRGDHFTARFNNGDVYEGTFELEPDQEAQGDGHDGRRRPGPVPRPHRPLHLRPGRRASGLVPRLAGIGRPAQGVPADGQPGVFVRRLPTESMSIVHSP